MPWGEHGCECPGCLEVPCPRSWGIRGRCGLVALVRETPNLGYLATSTNRGSTVASMAHITECKEDSATSPQTRAAFKCHFDCA